MHFPGLQSQMLLSISGLRPGPVRPCCAGPNRPAACFETGSSVGIADTTYLGFCKDKQSHIEVSRLCNQYKYALPTREIARKSQDEARGHCLCQSTSVLVRSSPCSVLCRQEFVVLCKPQYRQFGAANVLFRQGILQSLPQAQVSS